MAKLLEQAFSDAAKLPPKSRRPWAPCSLRNLASERRWTEAFARSHDTLAALAAEALAEHRAGRTRPFDSDRDLAHD